MAEKNEREFLESADVQKHLEDVTAAILRDRPSKEDMRNYIAKHFGGETEKKEAESSSAGKRVDTSKKDSSLIPGRESFTSDMKLFDEFLELANRNRSKDTVCHGFWEKLRKDLAACEPVGFPVQKQSEAIVDLDKTSEVCDAAMGRIFSTKRLMNLNPAGMAKDYDLTEAEVLAELLYAAKAGLVKMSWSGECPRCGGNAGSSGVIGDVPHNATCGACDFNADFSSLDKIKCVFRFPYQIFYAPVVADVCFFSTKAMQNIKFCKPIYPTEFDHGYKVHADLPKGKYRWICPHCKVNYRFEVKGDLPEDPDAPRLTMQVRDSDKPTKEDIFEHGKLDIQTWADNGSAMVAVIFPGEFTDDDLFSIDEHPQFTTAATTINHPVFQELFSSQVVSNTQRMSIESVTLAFTDIVGSTATYARLGDGKAMAMVQTHFEYLFDEIRKREGRVVKTVGDAVMASFMTGSNAIEAFVKAIQSIQAFNKSDECPPDTVLQIRVGLHSGHAIVVPLNGINDYFGQNVNTAARIEGKSKPNKILVTEAVLQAPSAKATLERLVKEGVVSTEEVEPLELKGVKDPVKATLLTVIEKSA